jgi:SET domain-containing protein
MDSTGTGATSSTDSDELKSAKADAEKKKAIKEKAEIIANENSERTDPFITDETKAIFEAIFSKAEDDLIASEKRVKKIENANKK